MKVAVIGSGPSGITCAGELARMGYDVTIFESLHKPGGVLTYGIPEFRLPKKIVGADIDFVQSAGVKIESSFLVGRTKTIDELRSDGFRAFFVGIGAGLPYFLGVDGESLNGIYSANEFLTRTNLMKSYLFPEYDTPVRIGKIVGVIGAGNVAMDSARCALRLGAETVYIIYRRTEKEMPARLDEIRRAKEEGIKFELLTHAVKFSGDEKGWVKEAVLMRNELGSPDASGPLAGSGLSRAKPRDGRRRPVPIKGSEFTMKLDTVVCAIGQGPNPLLPRTLAGLNLNEDGNIVVDKDHMTSIEGVFAGGDIVTGAATVISAMGAGKKAAAVIDAWLKACIVCGLIALFSSAAGAETIYLKSGEKVTGKIVGQSGKSTMIRDESGAYKSYSTGEIEKISKEDAPKEPIPAASKTSVTDRETKKDDKFYPYESSYSVKLEGGSTVKISLPQQWKRLKQLSGTFVIGEFEKNTKPKALLDLMSIYDKRYEKYNTNLLRKKLLEDFSNRTKERRVEPYDKTGVTEEYSDLSGVPCLTVTVQGSDGKIHKIIHFVKGSEFYSVTFNVYSKDDFEKEWPIIEQSLNAMEIQPG